MVSLIIGLRRHMAKKKITSRRVVQLAVLTLVTALVWVALNSYHELVKRDRMEGVEQLLTPLNPELQDEVLPKIKGKSEYKTEDIEKFLKVKPTSTASPLTEPSPTTELEPTREATESGEEK